MKIHWGFVVLGVWMVGLSVYGFATGDHPKGGPWLSGAVLAAAGVVALYVVLGSLTHGLLGGSDDDAPS